MQPCQLIVNDRGCNDTNTKYIIIPILAVVYIVHDSDNIDINYCTRPYQNRLW